MLKRVILVQCKTPGDVLRKLRTDRGLTQKAVAEALNINRSTYSFHESGKTQPDFQRVTALAAIFEVPLGQMVEMLAIGQLCPEEKSLIAIFRRCDPASRQEIYRAAKEKVHL